MTDKRSESVQKRIKKQNASLKETRTHREAAAGRPGKREPPPHVPLTDSPHLLLLPFGEVEALGWAFGGGDWAAAMDWTWHVAIVYLQSYLKRANSLKEINTSLMNSYGGTGGQWRRTTYCRVLSFPSCMHPRTIWPASIGNRMLVYLDRQFHAADLFYLIKVHWVGLFFVFVIQWDPFIRIMK